ncbi:hypothetical protein LJR260_004386 [Variovorax paradoxus]|uniref:hypothetical protein n=1 Tax=Variovorax paradoxus TaxID=34073 RepID=UPI0004255A61
MATLPRSARGDADGSPFDGSPEFAACRIHLSVLLYFSVFGMPNTEKVSNGSISGVFCLMGP